jgi:predicted dehydrogenase
VGTGFVGPHHVDAARRTGYADVVALVGTDPDRTRDRADRLGGLQPVTDLVAVLADPDIDVVHVCTPNHTHVEIASAVLEAGKHLVLEKPVATDLASAVRLVELAAASGRHAALALTYRGYPMVRRARELVAEGALGSVHLVHGAYLQDWLAEPTDYNWRLEPALGGPSRAVADIGTHWHDTAEFVSGRRIEAVFADLATFMPLRDRPVRAGRAFDPGEGPLEPVDVRSEDAATILVRFEGGARGSVVVSQVSHGHKNDMRLEIAGGGGSLSWHQEDPERLWIGGLAEERVVRRGPAPGQHGVGVPGLPAGHPEGWGAALRDLLAPFYAAVSNGTPPPTTGSPAEYPTLADGARGVAFVEAVLASAASGRWVSVGEPIAIDAPAGGGPQNVPAERRRRRASSAVTARRSSATPRPSRRSPSG